MKKLSGIIVLLLWGLSSIVAQDNKIGDILVKTLDGKEVNLKERVVNEENKLTMICFWATWCKACKTQLDHLSKLNTEWQEKYNVEVIAISMDSERTIPKIKGVVEERKWDYPLYIDADNHAFTALNFTVVPYTFIVNTQGEILYMLDGYKEGYEEQLKEKLEALRAE